jgi:hypothetical protein
MEISPAGACAYVVLANKRNNNKNNNVTNKSRKRKSGKEKNGIVIDKRVKW